MIVTSADSCKDTITEIVTIYPTPEVIFSVSDSVGCDSLEVIFTNNSDPFNGEDTTSMTFEWLVDGNPISTNTNTSYIFTNNTVDPITYEVILNGLTSHGCESSDTIYITIHPNPVSEINVSANYDTTNCAPFIINSNVISAGLYNNANDSYYWYIDSAGTVLNSYNTTGTIPPTYVMQQDGYSVTIYLVTNNNDSCTSDTTSVIFTTVLDPVALLDTNPRSGCHPFQPNIQSLSTPGTSHSWFVNGSPIQTPTPQTTLDYVFTNLSYTDSITYEVKLVIQAGGSGGLPCTDTIIDTVTVYPKPNAIFSPVIGNQCAPSCDDLIDASVYNNTSSIVWNWTITEDNSLYPSTPTTSNVQNPNICFPDNQSGTDVELSLIHI